MDALAIHTGIWAFDPRQSLDIALGGALPVEELIFFLLTTTLVVCGVTLGLSKEMGRRVARLFGWMGQAAPERRAG